MILLQNGSGGCISPPEYGSVRWFCEGLSSPGKPRRYSSLPQSDQVCYLKSHAKIQSFGGNGVMVFAGKAILKLILDVFRSRFQLANYYPNGPSIIFPSGQKIRSFS